MKVKIETSSVKKVYLTDIIALDPISVYLDDFGEGKGQITITCSGEFWTAFWGNMGDSNMTEFFLSCDNDYLSKKLSTVRLNKRNGEYLYKIIDAVKGGLK